MQDFGGVRLYRRGAALTLVRDLLTRGEHNGLPYSKPTPVVVFTGAGKTALLRELDRLVRPHAPCARVDCEDFSGGARHLLAMLAFELNRYSGRYGELPFPRLVTGLIAIGADLGTVETDADRDKARDRVRHALEERQHTAAPLQETISDVIGAGFDALGGGSPAVTKAAVDLLRRIGPRLVLGSLATTRAGRKLILGTGQDWYGHQDLGLKYRSLDVLVDLHQMVRRARRDAEDRRAAASLLWAAFLADLDSAFARRSAMNWTFNCLVLLDNADAPAGQEFLSELVAARKKRADEPPLTAQANPSLESVADPLTVIAASRGVLAGKHVPRGATITALSDASAADSVRSWWRWWYPVWLPDLAASDVGSMVSLLDLKAGTRRSGVTSALYRFTGGHPIAVCALTEAIAATTVTGIAELLDGPAPQSELGRPPALADHLLSKLLHDLPGEAVEDLVTCAAARDKVAALLLDAESDLLSQRRRDDPDFFGAILWAESPAAQHPAAQHPAAQHPAAQHPAAQHPAAQHPAAQHPAAGNPVLHPVLRRLLLRRLAVRPDSDPASWAAVHGWLRERALAAGDQVGALYHGLALGEVEHVSRRLATALPERGAAGWLDLLEAVTAAPNALPAGELTAGRAEALAAWAKPHGEPLAPVARLVTARWLSTDPLSDPHVRGLRREIHASLHDIAPSADSGIGTIRDYADSVYGDDPDPGVQPPPEPPPVSFAPPKSGRGRQRLVRLRVLTAAVALAAAAAAGLGIYTAANGGGGPALGSCAPAQGAFHVISDGGECVGVTDGSFLFDQGGPADVADQRNIRDAEQRILAENNAVLATRQPYVTVALLAVLTVAPPGSTSPSDVTLSRIADELRGAYLAQYYANTKGGLSPQIRLLLASEGSLEQGWQTDWAQLRALPATGSGELVAVAGMGISVQRTIDAANTIGRANVSMFGAVTTADNLNTAANPYLDQVVPSVANEVSALTRFLPRPSKAALVYDQKATDLYTSSLRQDFYQAFRSSLTVGQIPYVSTTLESPLFKKIAEDLCATSPSPVIFYAGRNSVLGPFIGQLEQEGDCNGKHLEIVTGGDADGLASQWETGYSGGAQVTVVYADIENPDPASLAPGFQADFQRWLGKGAAASMMDPWLLAYYNAMTAAANAIGDEEGSVQSDLSQLTAQSVSLWVHQLNISAAVAGAEGPLQISPSGTLESPAIPIIQLAGGRSTTLRVQR